jgi:hypothetical protein
VLAVNCDPLGSLAPPLFLINEFDVCCCPQQIKFRGYIFFLDSTFKTKYLDSKKIDTQFWNQLLVLFQPGMPKTDIFPFLRNDLKYNAGF